MTHYLSIQNTYHSVEIALCYHTTIIDQITESKLDASKNCITHIKTLLARNVVELNNISFIAVNQGPGPFTTLRVVIATVNGLSFATGIPLIGIDALHAMLFEYRNTHYPITIALLNAFNNDVYFGLDYQGTIETGSANITHFLTGCKNRFPNTTIRFIGNATQMHSLLIAQHFGSLACIPDPCPQTSSIVTISALGLQQWENKTGLSKEVMPLYLKNAI